MHRIVQLRISRVALDRHVSCKVLKCEKILASPIRTNIAVRLESYGTVRMVLSVVHRFPGECSCAQK